MNKDIDIDVSLLQQRVEQLIKEGEDLLSFGNKNEKQRTIEWFEKINILNERYLKKHPSHSAIHTVYFHSRYEKDSIEEMIPKLRAVLHDEDLFSNNTNSSTERKDEHVSELTKPVITKSSTVFISYSWDSEEHKIWVKGLADMLLSEGISVLIDQYDLNPGDRLTSFMEKSINDCDRALIICTPQYKTKADERLAGVGYESNIITADILQKHNDLKYIPVVRSGDFDTAMPTYMSGKLAVDLREENIKYEDSIQDLLATIRGETKKPPVNKTNNHKNQRMSQEALADDSILHIVGIITDEVTLPKNDGTRGSALYSIPFRLSGYPDAKWCEYFIHCWNYPSSFTTMHRPGIASIHDNKIVLNGTTIDEVQQYHRKTLIAAVKKANEMYDQYNQKLLQEKERKLEEEHKKRITDIASSMDFNEKEYDARIIDNTKRSGFQIMAKSIKQYDLLISCPGDATKAVDIIKEVVDEFNQNYSDTLGIGIRCRYWKDSAYAESGGKPQDLLNKQIVYPSDLAVAVFKNRFGSPTDKYGSGTEEEIEEMLSAGKQVFMFFDESPVKMTDVDRNEYEKVQDFKKKYKNKGIYWSFNSDEEFKAVFRTHITKYILSLIKEKNEVGESKHLTEHDKDVHKRISDDLERFKAMVYGGIERLDPFELEDFRFIAELLEFLQRSANHFVNDSLEELRVNLFESIQDFYHFQAMHTFPISGTRIHSTTLYLIESQPETSMKLNLPSVLNMSPDTYREKIKPYVKESQEYREKAKHVVKCFEEMEKRYLSLVN